VQGRRLKNKAPQPPAGHDWKDGRLFRPEAVQQSTGAILPIRRQWTPEGREQLLTLERPPSAPTVEAKKSLAGAHLAE